MKEFKFRAWDKREKIMGEVSYIRFFKSQYTQVSVRFKKNKKKGKVFDDWYAYGQEDGSDNIILMQYTGLKDRNGQEIYDGDILRADIAGSIRIVKVVYKNGAFYIENIPHVQEQMFNTFPIGMCKPVYEVIGNIYDNPEMLTDEV